MNAPSPVLYALTIPWFIACVAAFLRLVLRRRGQPLRSEDGMTLGAIALLAVAPVVWLGIAFAGGRPTLSAAAAQLLMAGLLFAGAWRARRARRDPEAAASASTFREKSALTVVAALLFVFGHFFVTTRGMPADDTVAAFVAAVVSLIVLMIAGHIVIAVLHAPLDDLDAPRDERDRRIELKSLRNAYFVLAAAFWGLPVVLLTGMPVGTALTAWLAALVAAECVYYGSVAGYYRFGTD